MKKRKYKLDRPLLMDRKDERYEDYCKDLEETGISPDEMWSLDYSIAVFTLPRLQLFKKYAKGCCPGGISSSAEWQRILGKMIKAFRHIAKEEHYVSEPKVDKAIEEGLELFHKHYFALWT
jgi:hypothetical protein